MCACTPRRFSAVALATVAFTLLAMVVVPTVARADGFSMPRVDIHATVETDGSLAVTEARRFEFNDDVNGIFWTIPAGENQQGSSVSLEVTGVNVDDGSGTRDFTPVDYASNGDDGVYETSWDGSGAVLKVYAPHADGDAATVTVRYKLVGAVMAWSDTAELYWQFVGDGWDEASKDVSLTVDFAGAAGAEEPVKGEFLAWAHGPLTGTVTPHRDAKTVDFQVPSVRPGEYAEARVAFPVAWVPGLATVPESRMDTILGKEHLWAEEANARRERARKTSEVMAAAQVGLPTAFLAVVAIARARLRKPKPVFQDAYFRDLPSDDHPAVIAAFMHNGAVGDEAMVSTLMKLTDDRAVTLEPTSRTEKGLFGSKTEDDYVLRMTQAARDAVGHAIDRAALDLYFLGCPWRASKGAPVSEADDAGAHADATPGDAGNAATAQDVKAEQYRSRTFAGLQEYAKDHSNAYSDALDEYKSQVKAFYEQRNLVASTGAGAKGVCVGVGVLLLLGSVFALVESDATEANIIAFCASVPITVAAVAIGFTFKRFTQEGAELYAKCAALKKWLEDFTRLNEAVPGDLILWNKLLVMAVALGVSDEVLRQLADAVPAEMREDTSTGGYYYPVYWWCYGHNGMAAPVGSFHEAYSASISELASSANSSAGGFGGGFSGGGGGGVGGGGGGTF